MPALNMPAVNTPVVTPANPSTGRFVLMSPFSGPKGSPFDAKQFNPLTLVLENAPTNFSTGGLSTGIGFGANHIIGPVAPQSIDDAGFDDDYTPGLTEPDSTDAAGAWLVAIGGGRSTIEEGTGPDGNGTPPGTFISAPDPYAAGFELLGFGNGGSRDAGAGPIFTGFASKMVTATGAVANGAAIEAGFINRSGLGMVDGESAFGSNAAASAAIA